MKQVLTEKHSSILVLKINRTEKANSLTLQLLEDLAKSIAAAHKDRDLKALILTGEGNRFFCSGADLDELTAQSFNVTTFSKAYLEVIDLLLESPFLTSAFINGDCVGGGLGIALATDFLLGASHARFGTPDLTKGLFPFIVSPTMIKKLGTHKTMTLCFGGKLITAPESQTLGILSETVASDQFSKRGHELISAWNQMTLETIRNGKRAIAFHDETDKGDLIEFLSNAIETYSSTTP